MNYEIDVKFLRLAGELIAAKRHLLTLKSVDVAKDVGISPVFRES